MECGASRPRKLEEDLSVYITSIDISWTNVATFFTELSSYQAPAAVNKHSSKILELAFDILSSCSSTVQKDILVSFIKDIAPYFGYLAYHTYASRILQAFIAAVYSLLLLSQLQEET